MRASRTILPFLAVCLAYILASERRTKVAAELRCQCVKTESRMIPSRQILNFEIIPKGTHCKHLQVIATVKTGRETSQAICLDPTASWVKRHIDRLLNSSKTPKTPAPTK